MKVSPMKKTTDHSKPDISVVIPMYNCEQFVPGLLAMFSRQKFRSFEVICVIDGATDGTEDAVREFCKTDARFRFITRENGGAGAARNTGMDAARGRYIIFPDADDLYSRNYLQKLYRAAESQAADIAVCLTETMDYRAGEKRNLASFSTRALREGTAYSLNNTEHLLQMVDVQVANKLFLLDYIRSLSIRFSEVPASNDLFFSKAAIAGAERIVFVHQKLVTIQRYINPSSISSNRGNRTHYALYELQKLYHWLEEQNLCGRCMEDYLRVFDNTVNYEMKNGVNPVFAEEMARMLQCSRPWTDMSREQIMQALRTSMGETGMERIKPLRPYYSAGKAAKINARNEISRNRNETKRRMQELVREKLDAPAR